MVEDAEQWDETSEIDVFRDQVRHALEHLYDPDVLTEHWLVHRLNLAHAPARSRALRQYLIDAIQGMRPPPGESPDSPRWQMAQVLLQRYVQCTSASALADQLGMSSRNLRRLQTRALAQLAESLLHQSHQGGTQVEDPITEAEQRPDGRSKRVDEEIGWLRGALSEPVDVSTLLAETLQLLEAVSHRAGVQIALALPPDLPLVAIHPTGLRQVMMSILNYALQYTATGRIEISATTSEEQVTIEVKAIPAFTVSRSTSAIKLVVARHILAMFGGRLQQSQEPNNTLCLTFTLAAAGRTNVLVIDDNTDALQLYKRYATGTRYELTICEKPEQALAMAVKLHPRIIVMDIMMPGLDGWALLGQLRHHPVTTSIPIIMCTIVSEKDLALSLGAADFVQKPVTRIAFLAALDRLSATKAPASH